MKTIFVPKSALITAGNTKKQFAHMTRAAGNIPSYSGKTIYDKDGNMVREPGFFVTLH